MRKPNKMLLMRSGCLLALVFALLARTTSIALPRLSVGTARGFPGNTVELPVSLRYGTNDAQDVVALQADIVFDGTGIEDGKLENGQMLARHVLASSRPGAGV